MAGKSNNPNGIITVLTIILLTFGINTGIRAAAEDANSLSKSQILKKAASDWLEIGTNAYNRGFYIESETALLRAREYLLYMNSAQQEKLEQYSENAHEKALELRRLQSSLDQGRWLIQQGRLERAKVAISDIENRSELPEIIRQNANKLKAELKRKINAHKKEMDKLFGESVVKYHKGELDEAKKGFLKVSESEFYKPSGEFSAEDYLDKIKTGKMSQVQGDTSERTLKDVPAGESDSGDMLDIAQPDGEKKVLDEATRRRNIRRSYAKAVVKDSLKETDKLLKNGQYYKAKESVQKAKKVIEQQRPDLGEALYNDFLEELNKRKEKIEKQRQKWLGKWQENQSWQM